MMIQKNNPIRVDFQEIIESDSGCLSNDSHYIVLCPFCLYERKKERRKLYIKKDLTTGYCFTCGNTFVPDKSSFRRPLCIMNSKERRREYAGVSPIDLSIFDRSVAYSEEGVEYLNSRPDRMIGTDYQRFGIRFVENGILLPIRTFGSDEIVFYQLRYIKPFRQEMKYFMPSIPEKPVAVVQKGNSGVCWCVEGIFGGIAISRLYENDTIIAMLGKFLTPFHEWQLSQQTFHTYNVFLDDTELSLNLCNQIRNSIEISSPSINYVESDGRDPDESLSELIGMNGVLYQPLQQNKPSWKKKW